MDRQRNAASGMTLVELMIAVAIVGILSALAYPSYRVQVTRSHRTEAKAALLDSAQRMEKCFTRLYTFSGCDVVDFETKSKRYLIDVSSMGQTFTITATPQGMQKNDVACGTLSIDNRGRKDKSGTGTLAECWEG